MPTVSVAGSDGTNCRFLTIGCWLPEWLPKRESSFRIPFDGNLSASSISTLTIVEIPQPSPPHSDRHQLTGRGCGVLGNATGVAVGDGRLPESIPFNHAHLGKCDATVSRELVTTHAPILHAGDRADGQLHRRQFDRDGAMSSLWTLCSQAASDGLFGAGCWLRTRCWIVLRGTSLHFSTCCRLAGPVTVVFHLLRKCSRSSADNNHDAANGGSHGSADIVDARDRASR